MRASFSAKVTVMCGPLLLSRHAAPKSDRHRLRARMNLLVAVSPPPVPLVESDRRAVLLERPEEHLVVRKLGQALDRGAHALPAGAAPPVFRLDVDRHQLRDGRTELPFPRGRGHEAVAGGPPPDPAQGAEGAPPRRAQADVDLVAPALHR